MKRALFEEGSVMRNKYVVVSYEIVGTAEKNVR